jgi:hypothetical protein
MKTWGRSPSGNYSNCSEGEKALAVSQITNWQGGDVSGLLEM